MTYAALLRACGFPYLVAAVGAFTVAATNNYTWNRVWTFRAQRRAVALQGMQFLVVAGAALSANLLVLRALVEMGIGPVPAQATAIILVTPLNFQGNKVWTFQHRSPGSAPFGRRGVRALSPALLFPRLRHTPSVEFVASQLEEPALPPATVSETS